MFGQYRAFCGERTVGHIKPALCHECGGPYKLKGQYRLEDGPRVTNRYTDPANQRLLVIDLKASDKWIPWLYSAPIKDL